MKSSKGNVMNKKFKTIASVVVTLTLVLTTIVTPAANAVAVTQFESQFGFDTNLDFGSGLGFGTSNLLFDFEEPKLDPPAGVEPVTSESGSTEAGAVVYDSSSSFTECALEASRNLVTIGESITLNWDTKGFDTLTINGSAVSGDSGSMIIDNLQKNTKFTLEALSNNGSKCVQEVVVNCEPPQEKECKLELEKSVNKNTALPGDSLTYTITVKNTGTANCTGGGVQIQDWLDNNLRYVSHQITNNLTAGYGTYPVYDATNHALYFNGNTLEPGESGTITLVGEVKTPAQCGDFEVKNQAKATAKELNNFKNWSYSQSVKTAVDNDCEDPKDKFATVVAHKIICTDESDLPNYGNGGPNMTSNTAVDWVANHDSCELAAGWEFEWTNNQSSDPGDTKIGVAGAPWSTFGPTGSDGKAYLSIKLNDLTNDRVWFREVLQSGYIPFTHGLNGGTNVDAVSAEFYCDQDVVNYDNFDYINGMKEGQTYYCVAWNSPIPSESIPSCDLFEATPATIMVGETATLNWETTNSVQAFINNGIGAVALDGSIEVSPLADVTYTLTVIGEEDKVATCEVPVKVKEDKVPVCESFTATPSLLAVGGGSVILDWSVVDGLSATISPIVGAVALSGTTSVDVTESTTFTLTAVDDNGDEVTCSAPVVVPDPELPLTCADNVSFSATDYSIVRGETLSLNWSTVGVDAVSISQINATTLAGSQSVSPTDDITYVLKATRGSESVECPLSVTVSSGGGGGSSSPRCDLDISDTLIKVGEEITLEWDTSRATEVTLMDDRGKILFTTDDYLASEKSDYYDGSITLKPTRDTKYTLLAERGRSDRECSVKVEIEDSVVVLQTRDQQPLVAGISLSQVPYTGFEAGPIMTAFFYLLLVAWALYITYLLLMRNKSVTPDGTVSNGAASNYDSRAVMKQAEERRPDVFVKSVAPADTTTMVVPSNLPIGTPVVGYENQATEEETINPHQVNDSVVTDLENRAHSQKALLSSDAVRHFVATTSGELERNEALDAVITEAKKNYPLEDGWIVINESRMKNLCVACQLNAAAKQTGSFVPATVPEGTGSLAEAIVTGNVVAAYEMIGNRPMFALADAAADLDAVYRYRRGGTAKVSDMLVTETKELSDEQIKNMITALTSALDGTYTDEASAVKMAIMKSVKEAA